MSVDPASHPFDPGLQPERTALAWRRTALSVAVGSLVGMRLVSEALGVAGIALGAAGLVGAAGISVLAHRRYRTTHLALTSAPGDRVELGGAALIAATAGTVLVLALAAAATVVALAGAST